MLIYNCSHIQFRLMHCKMITMIPIICVILLSVSWSIPQTVYWNNLNDCMIINSTNINVTTCSPNCGCSETPTSIVSTTPMCNTVNVSDVQCNNGYLCCQVCCGTCSTCTGTSCSTFSCNCNCCLQIQNNFCTQSCLVTPEYQCTLVGNITVIVDIPCVIGSYFKCSDNSVIFTSNVYPWQYFGIPSVMLGVTLLLYFSYLLFAKTETPNGVV